MNSATLWELSMVLEQVYCGPRVTWNECSTVCHGVNSHLKWWWSWTSFNIKPCTRWGKLSSYHQASSFQGLFSQACLAASYVRPSQDPILKRPAPVLSPSISAGCLKCALQHIYGTWWVSWTYASQVHCWLEDEVPPLGVSASDRQRCTGERANERR